jgi:hypothetical protein
MLAAWPLAEQQPARCPALSEETFTAAQWTGQTSAGAALAQMASRFAKGEGELSRLVREQQNLSWQWQQIDRHIIATRSLPRERRDAAAEAALGQRLGDTDRQLVALNARLKQEFPEYAALSNPEPLSFKDVQDQLRPDEALVQFAFSGDQAFAWVVIRDAARWERLSDATANIRAKVQALRCGLDLEGEWQWEQDKRRLLAHKKACATLRPYGLTADEPPPFNLAVAHDLYEALFGSIKDDIEGKHLITATSGLSVTSTCNGRLVSAPDGTMSSDAAAYARVAWLARSHAITVLPSVASLKLLRTSAGKSPATKPLLATRCLLAPTVPTSAPGSNSRAQETLCRPLSPRAVFMAPLPRCFVVASATSRNCADSRHCPRRRTSYAPSRATSWHLRATATLVRERPRAPSKA